jgi:hypothetical protein
LLTDSQATVRGIVRLHDEATARWHRGVTEVAGDDFSSAVMAQHRTNFLLWHEEDRVRDPGLPAEETVRIKRSVDRLNRQRNDGIERVDDFVSQALKAARVRTPKSVPTNTETPGCAVDRLSVLSLRAYHLAERVGSRGLRVAERRDLKARLALCREQRKDLENALAVLLDDIRHGRRRLRVFRHLKIYGGA